MQSTYVLCLWMLRSAKHKHCKRKSNIHLEILIIFFPEHTTNDIRNVHNLFSIRSLLLVCGPSDIHLFSPVPAKKFNFLSHTKFLGSHYYYTMRISTMANWASSVAPHSRKNCVHVSSTSDRMLIGLNEELTNYDSQHSLRGNEREVD